MKEGAAFFHAVLMSIWTWPYLYLVLPNVSNTTYDEWKHFKIHCINSKSVLTIIWKFAFFVSPTVLEGWSAVALSRDFCFLSLSLSLRRWQRWWWWWWWALSWPCNCPSPVEDWARPGRSRSYSLSPTSWCRWGVSEDAERLIGLRSTMGCGRRRSVERRDEKVEQGGRLWWFYPNHLYWITKTSTTNKWHNRWMATFSLKTDVQSVLLQAKMLERF